MSFCKPIPNILPRLRAVPVDSLEVFLEEEYNSVPADGFLPLKNQET